MSEPSKLPSVPYVTGMLSFAFLLAIVDRMVFSLLIAPIKADLNITDAEAGSLAGLAFGLFYTIMGLPLGSLADRVNRPRLICAGVLLWSVATAACGFATSFWSLFILRVCVGVGEAAISPAAYSLLADCVPRNRLARSLGIYMMGIVGGVAVAWIVGGRILAAIGTGQHFGLPMKPWSIVFIAVAAPGVLVAPALALIRDPRSSHGSRHAKIATNFAAVAGQLRLGWRAYASHFIGVGALNTFGFAMLTWTPSMFMREFGWSIGDAGQILGLAVGSAGAVGMYGFGALADEMGRRGAIGSPFRLMICASLIMIPFTFSIAFTSSAATRLGVFLVPVMTLFFAVIACAPTAIQLATPSNLRGSVSAVYLFAVNVSAFAIGPTLVGSLADRHGGDPNGLAKAILAVGSICVSLAALSFCIGLRPYLRLARSQDVLAGRSEEVEQRSPI